MSKAGAERATPLATATLVVAANAPDVDILSFVNGPYFALAFRRGITHGWPALVVLSFVVTAGILAWDRLVRRRRDPGADPARGRAVLALAAIGLLTHPALDWMNTYGMRWWLPFDGRWSYGDALFIIDPWIWLALGGAVFLAHRPGPGGALAWGSLAALATVAVGYGAGPAALLPWALGLGAIVALRRRGGDDPVRRARRARLALAAGTAYVALMVVQGPLAARAVRAEAVAAGLEVEDVMVAPVPGNPLRADVEVLTPDGVVPGSHAWLPPSVSLDPAEGVRRLAKPPALPDATASAIVEAARDHPDVRAFLTWSRYPLVVVTPIETGWNVRFTDARYDDRPEAGSLAGLTVVVPHQDPVRAMVRGASGIR